MAAAPDVEAITRSQSDRLILKFIFRLVGSRVILPVPKPPGPILPPDSIGALLRGRISRACRSQPLQRDRSPDGSWVIF